MYSVDRWLLPLYVYFDLLQSAQGLSHFSAFYFPGIQEAFSLSGIAPGAYYGFVGMS
jgi:hypothetical protein